jgi:hypothetical protein
MRGSRLMGLRRTIMVAGLMSASMRCWMPAAAADAPITNWPPSGGWAVLALPSGPDQQFCTLMTRLPPDGPAGYGMSFAFHAFMAQPHFYLNYQGPEMTPPTALPLMVDGRTITILTPSGQRQLSDGTYLLRADFAAHQLDDVVLPALSKGSVVATVLGGRRFTVPLRKFGPIAKDVDDCAYMLAN